MLSFIDRLSTKTLLALRVQCSDAYREKNKTTSPQREKVVLSKMETT